MRFSRLPLIAKVHDLAVMCAAVGFASREEWAVAGALAGWWAFMWLCRITLHTDILDWALEWTEWIMPDWFLPMLAGMCLTVAIEIIILWFTWRDIVNYIVGHY